MIRSLFLFLFFCIAFANISAMYTKHLLSMVTYTASSCSSSTMLLLTVLSSIHRYILFSHYYHPVRISLLSLVIPSLSIFSFSFHSYLYFYSFRHFPVALFVYVKSIISSYFFSVLPHSSSHFTHSRNLSFRIFAYFHHFFVLYFSYFVVQLFFSPNHHFC